MPYDVFISYASVDRSVADVVHRHLEAAGVRCWIDQHGIGGGAQWLAEIATAIEESSIMVLVFSKSADSSKYVHAEVSLAFDKNMTIIPLRIEDVRPTGGMKVLLVNFQYINALGQPLEQCLDQIVERIKRLTAPSAASVPAARAATTPSSDARTAPARTPTEVPGQSPAPPPSASPSRRHAVAPHQVFISYASKDQATANALCAHLEKARVRCWIAQDIRPGRDFLSEILEAIESSQIFVLIFSSNANSSRHVLQEIAVAAERGLMILPIRVEDVTPTGAMSYYLGAVHWLDALSPPLEQHWEKVAKLIRPLITPSA